MSEPTFKVPKELRDVIKAGGADNIMLPKEEHVSPRGDQTPYLYDQRKLALDLLYVFTPQ